MARTSKIALIAATTLAILAVLTGSLVASAETRAATATQSSQTTVYTADGSTSTPSESTLADNGGQYGRSAGRSGTAPQGMGPMSGYADGRDDGWNVSDILQWIAIGILAGLAVALAIWRPWRPGHGPATAPAGAAPVAYYEAPVTQAPSAEAVVPAATMTPATPVAPTGSRPVSAQPQSGADAVGQTQTVTPEATPSLAPQTLPDDVPAPPASAPGSPQQ